jgi:hypothetical protein
MLFKLIMNYLFFKVDFFWNFIRLLAQLSFRETHFKCVFYARYVELRNKSKDSLALNQDNVKRTAVSVCVHSQKVIKNDTIFI